MYKNNTIPTGQLKINAVVLKLTDFKSKKTGALDLKYTADIRILDPVTAEPKIFNGIEVIQPIPNIPISLDVNDLCTLKCENYNDLANNNKNNLKIIINEKTPLIQNKAIPIKSSNSVDNYSSANMANCKNNKLYNSTKKWMQNNGIIPRDKNIKILSLGNSDESRSSGIISNQVTGEISVFDKSGKQKITLKQDGMSLASPAVDTGNAKRQHSNLAYGGLPSDDNILADVLPQGPIVSPHPKALPAITTILNTIVPIMDMVDLVKLCGTAVDVIFNSDPDAPDKNKNPEEYAAYMKRKEDKLYVKANSINNNDPNSKYYND